jgi:hypothetical protein
VEDRLAYGDDAIVERIRSAHAAGIDDVYLRIPSTIGRALLPHTTRGAARRS